MNFKLQANGKREDYKVTSDQYEKFVHVLFAQYRCKAYIGRGWQHLVLILQSEFKQQSS